jgi:glycosyltransferase involved in cell wall biosynthesis
MPRTVSKSRADSAAVPFTLSVIMRTQGRRPQALADAVLCLQAQTDQAFELILVAHNATQADERALSTYISQLDAQMEQKVTVTSVRGGARCVPLNAGLALARGSHVAIFDDDDLLFANWVEEFHRAAAEHPRTLLRAQVFDQQVAPEQWRGGTSGLRTLSWPKKTYPAEFSMVDHILVNQTPFMSVAFPRELFTELGQSFNEDLVVVEDWDMIIRGAQLLGVVDISEVTSIYRQWQRAENSQAIHGHDDWKASEALVTVGLDAGLLVLPPGSASRIQELLLKEERLSNHSEAVLTLATFVRRQGRRVVKAIRLAKSAARKILR